VAPQGTERELERWGADLNLVALLGEQGAQEFRALFDGFPEQVGALWALRDADGGIVDFAFGYANPAMMRGFRLPPETADRYTLLEAYPALRDSRAFEAYIRVCDVGEPWVSEITWDTPFGDGYMLGTFILRAAKLGDGLIVFLTDVTEKRRMETELTTYADVVAHDLREPLATMSILVKRLERTPDEPPPPEVLRLLQASTERAAELIDGVLDYARVGELQRERVALGSLLADVVEDLRPGMDGAGATLEAGELPEVEGDPRQLRRVFQNLVANALKFRGKEAPRIEVSAERGSREWIVSVRDNGVGVAPEDSSRIFAIFARSDSEAEGLGMGLAVCRGVVEAHGGRIWVEPAEGGGSDFRFTLPA
jgi:signal transduction histidine kinase